MSMDTTLDVLMNDDFETEPHAVPQTDYLESVGYKLDYIGRLEQLSLSLNQIYQATGILLTPQRLNRARQLHVLPTPKQFYRLVDLYQRDIETFGYCDNYENWCEIYFHKNRSNYQREAGFTFDREAKLIDHKISTCDVGFKIDLTWRVHPDQSRRRVVRVGIQRDHQFNVLFHFRRDPICGNTVMQKE